MKHVTLTEKTAHYWFVVGVFAAWTILVAWAWGWRFAVIYGAALSIIACLMRRAS